MQLHVIRLTAERSFGVAVGKVEEATILTFPPPVWSISIETNPFG
jgi:hypothetical protein